MFDMEYLIGSKCLPRQLRHFSESIFEGSGRPQKCIRISKENSKSIIYTNTAFSLHFSSFEKAKQLVSKKPNKNAG